MVPYLAKTAVREDGLVILGVWVEQILRSGWGKGLGWFHRGDCSRAIQGLEGEAGWLFRYGYQRNHEEVKPSHERYCD